MTARTYQVTLALEKVAGGWPGTIDALRVYLQNPALSKRVPAEAREEFLAQERDWGASEAAGTVADIIKTGFRKLPDRRPFLASFQIKAMLQGAARALYDTTSRPSIYQVARALTYGLEVRPTEIIIEGGRDGGVTRISQIIAHPRNPQIKVPSVRERDLWVGGSVSFTVYVLDQGASGRALEESVLRALFESGGMFIGLGTDRGYGNGRFEMTKFDAGPGAARAEALEEVSPSPRRKGIGYTRTRRAKEQG